MSQPLGENTGSWRHLAGCRSLAPLSRTSLARVLPHICSREVAMNLLSANTFLSPDRVRDTSIDKTYGRSIELSFITKLLPQTLFLLYFLVRTSHCISPPTFALFALVSEGLAFIERCFCAPTVHEERRQDRGEGKTQGTDDTTSQVRLLICTAGNRRHSRPRPDPKQRTSTSRPELRNEDVTPTH